MRCSKTGGATTTSNVPTPSWPGRHRPRSQSWLTQRPAGALRYAKAPRPGLLPEQKHQAQINPGLYLSLDKKRGHVTKSSCRSSFTSYLTKSNVPLFDNQRTCSFVPTCQSKVTARRCGQGWRSATAPRQEASLMPSARGDRLDVGRGEVVLYFPAFEQNTLNCNANRDIRYPNNFATKALIQRITAAMPNRVFPRLRYRSCARPALIARRDMAPAHTIEPRLIT